MPLRLTIVLSLSLLAWPWSPAGADAPRYRVAVDRDLARMTVTVCQPGGLPERLTPVDADVTAALVSATLKGTGSPRPLALSEGALAIPAGVTGCLSYDLDLIRGTGDGDRSWRGLVYRALDAVLVSPHLFLWEPPAGVEGATLTFDLPPGLKVSAPWPESVRGGGIYRLGGRPLEWDARVAIGRFDTLDLAFPGGQLAVAVLAADPPAAVQDVRDWLTANARALSKIGSDGGDGLHLGRLQVLVVPIGHGDEPVPWGEVMRGGGDAVHLYIDQTQPPAAFLADWVLMHELSHLLHPNLEGDGRWLYEGLATYYQEALRARAGSLTEADAWQRLHQGFERGRIDTRVGKGLGAASEAMMRQRDFMRVYWSGAAIALLADLELRRPSGGRQSLDRALLDLRRRYGPFDRAWGVWELIEALDEVTGSRVFSTLAKRWLPADRFPDLGEAYGALGLRAIDPKTLRLDAEPEAVRLRQQIMGRHPGH